MKEEEKISPVYNFFTSEEADAQGDWPQDGYYFNFKLPKEVKEFKFLIYKTDNELTSKDIFLQYNMKLNKK